EASELGVADVNVTEVRARLGVVCPNLFLVLKRRGASVRVDDHRRLPGALLVVVALRDVVCPRNGDTEQLVNDGARKDNVVAGRVPGADEVGVVQTRPVRPGEMATRVTSGSEGDGGITLRHQSCLVVPRKRVNRPYVAIGGDQRVEGVEVRPAGVGRLLPGSPLVKGES